MMMLHHPMHEFVRVSVAGIKLIYYIPFSCDNMQQQQSRTNKQTNNQSNVRSEGGKETTGKVVWAIHIITMKKMCDKSTKLKKFMCQQGLM